MRHVFNLVVHGFCSGIQVMALVTNCQPALLSASALAFSTVMIIKSCEKLYIQLGESND
jgi:hypothetical protein